MAEPTVIEQIDRAIDALLARRDSAPPADTEVGGLLRLAADLRDLPRADFKARLKSDLERRATMTTSTVKPVRAGVHSVTPYLAVRQAEKLIEFVRQAFGADGRVLGIGSEGGLHAEFRIGDSTVMIGGGAKWRGTPLAASLHLYVPDADAVYQRALAAGAASLYAPMDQPYGDREAGIEDLSGNQWFIATHKATGQAPEGFGTLTPGLRVKGAPGLVDFLKRAFGAEELSLTHAPDGSIIHGEVRIGGSMLELGEAHGRWGPMPAMLLLYVDDVDAGYRRALEAGATSTSEPADQPYGGRVAAVADAFGNLWYLSTWEQWGSTPQAPGKV
ncbi:MAG: VOC family protein [Candidatus Acidiferrales bacterium]